MREVILAMKENLSTDEWSIEGGSTSPLTRTFLEAHARTVVVQKFNAALFQRRLDFEQRARLGANVALEGFHAPDGADRDMRRCGKPRLIPSQ